MDDINPVQDEQEKELGRLVEALKTLPAPADMPAKDRTFVIRHIESNPSLRHFPRTGLQQFLVNSSTLPDGRTLCVIDGQATGQRIHFSPLGWGSPFGGCLRLFFSTKRKKQATFVVGSNDFESLQAGRIILAFYRLGRLADLKEFDLSSSSETASNFSQLIAMCRSTNQEIIAIDKYVFDDDLVRAHSCTEKYFGDMWTRVEWLQHGWIDECASRSSRIIKSLEDRSGIEAAKEHSVLESRPLLRGTATALLNTRSRKNELLRSLITLYKNSAIVDLLLELVSVKDELSSGRGFDPGHVAAIQRVSEIAYDTLQLLELDAQMSNWGTNQISWKTHTGDAPYVKGETITLDPHRFPISSDNAAKFYWDYKRPDIPSNRSRILSAHDFPIDPKVFFRAFENWQPILDEHEAGENIRHLLNEAVAMKEWTIPPNAFVELQLGPFVGVEVTEVGDDVYFVWRTPENLYLDMSVDVRAHIFANTEIYALDAMGVNRKAQLAMHLLMSSIIRDFWVVAERRKLFDVKRSRKTAQHKEDDTTPRVIYIPRVRYLGAKFSLSALSESLDYRTRSQHYVKPFFRKAQPSTLQLEVAHRMGVTVPPEHTYVRGHYRGLERTEGQRVYRSRSALELLFDPIGQEPPFYNDQLPTDWFAFEEAISVLLEKSFNCTIAHRSTRGKTDYGIDILATKPIGESYEMWVVQCKCYKPSNLIGPSHIRELLGAIADMKVDKGTTVRGLMVTTSHFSGDALQLALKHGIQCVNGDDLSAIFTSVNRTVDTTALN